MAKKTPEQISYNMSRVKNKDSAIEVALRKELWSRGLNLHVCRIITHTEENSDVIEAIALPLLPREI